ncbi:MAG: alpha/beta hydrolase [Pseudomonadota bacterium]|nr:alpha/beta hydrolase [Pseudomonadota bacterium]
MIRIAFAPAPMPVMGFVSGKGDLLTVWLEGDGHAMDRLKEASDDPSPHDPVALRLAAADPARPIAWLARPCQYRLPDPACRTLDWTSARYGPRILDSLNAALDSLKARTGAHRLRLAGFSGGGVVAVLLAARRNDIAQITTIAAPLDTDAWTAHHGVSPLTGSLNPMDVAEQVVHIQQTHYAGGNDKIVPSAVMRNFADNALVVVPDMNHNNWPDIWPITGK